MGENVAESDKDALIFVERRWLFRGRGKGRELLVLELEVRHFTWSECWYVSCISIVHALSQQAKGRHSGRKVVC